jgi:hypothetical protein
MRPESEYRPADGAKPFIRVRITLLVRLDLLPPELCVPFRPRGVLGATMPEAAIDEDGYLSPGKGDICDATGASQNLVVDPVAKTDSIHFLPQCHFRIRPLLPHLCHAATGIG